MNRIVIVSSLVVLWLTSVTNTIGQGFRGFPWGTSEKKIMQKEGQPNTYSLGGHIVYANIATFGNMATVWYNFLPNRGLQKGGYAIDVRSKKDVTPIFEKMVSMYGNSERVTINGINEYRWTTLDSKIVLAYDPANVKSPLTISYYDIKSWSKKDGSYREKLAHN